MALSQTSHYHDYFKLDIKDPRDAFYEIKELLLGVFGVCPTRNMNDPFIMHFDMQMLEIEIIFQDMGFHPF